MNTALYPRGGAENSVEAFLLAEDVVDPTAIQGYQCLLLEKDGRSRGRMATAAQQFDILYYKT